MFPKNGADIVKVIFEPHELAEQIRQSRAVNLLLQNNFEASRTREQPAAPPPAPKSPSQTQS